MTSTDIFSGAESPKLPSSFRNDQTVRCGPAFATTVWSENHFVAARLN